MICLPNAVIKYFESQNDFLRKSHRMELWKRAWYFRLSFSLNKSSKLTIRNYYNETNNYYLHKGSTIIITKQ